MVFKRRKNLAWGESPIGGKPLSAYLHLMKPSQKKKALTFGDLIESTYRACGKRRARGIIRFAAKARLIVFEGHGPFLVS